MNRKNLAILFVLAAVSVFAALPAFAFNYAETCNGSGVRWQNSTIKFVILDSQFPPGSAQKSAVEAAIYAWNFKSPGNIFRFTYEYANGVGVWADGQNSIRVAASGQWQWPTGWAANTPMRRSHCSFFPTDGAHYLEADILINPSEYGSMDLSTNPVPSDYMENLTSVLLHELGHAVALGHEDDVLATMNSWYPTPVGGPIGTRNDIHPLGDDVRGARNAYGTSGTISDIAASAVRLVSPGTSRTIAVPASSFRNAPVSFQFTVLNRGTTDQTIPVYFYLSPTRNVDPATRFYLGSTSVYLQYSRMTTGSVTLTIPSNAPTGAQYISWVTDPNNGIPESDEGNNAVALVSPTAISTNRVPTACFSASPTSGNAPVTVNVNASCTSDPDGTAGMTYSWDFGDGSWPETGVTASHTYYTGGYYAITLTVTDPSGAVSYTYRNVSVTCPQGSPWCEEPL